MKKYFQAPWSIKDLLICASVSLLLFIGAFLLSGFLKANPGIMLNFSIQWLILILPIAILTYKKYELKWQHFGFNKIGIWKAIKSAMGGYFLYLCITLIITTVIIYWGLKIPGYQIQKNILPLFGDDAFAITLAGLIIVLVAPVLEEILFRGFLLATLTNKIGVFLGSIISALIFSFLHFPWQSIIPIFILGLITNSLYLRTRSIWPTIIFHIINNAIAFTFAILIAKNVISLK